MQKESEGENARGGGLAYFPAPLDEVASPPGPAGLGRAAAGATPPARRQRAVRAQVARDELDQARELFERLRRESFTVREIAGALGADAVRLLQRYRAQTVGPQAIGPDPALDARLLAPLLEHLAPGVQVADVHKLLNVARDPLFPEEGPLRGKTAARHFPLQQAIALYLIWRLGHSFHLVPRVRKAIAAQFSRELLHQVIYGAPIGLAVTPFVALVAPLDDLLKMGHPEIVAFSLNGLVCQALHAFAVARH